MGSPYRRRDRIVTNRIGARRASDTPEGNEAESERFQLNVFTWIGAGVENLFIAHEPERLHRRTRRSWN